MMIGEINLHDLATKWGTDKAIFYAPFYDSLFGGRRDQVNKVLEFGIGYPECMLPSVSRMNLTSYTTGASLFMWEEYFPNAEIYALDNKPEILINEGRIKSFYCDQGDENSFVEAIKKIGSGFDFIIEDGSHDPKHQILSVRLLVPLLKDGGIYIVEDIVEPFDTLLEQISYPCKVEKFYRPDLTKGSNIAAIIVIRA